jgi:hypothetical protein
MPQIEVKGSKWNIVETPIVSNSESTLTIRNIDKITGMVWPDSEPDLVWLSPCKILNSIEGPVNYLFNIEYGDGWPVKYTIKLYRNSIGYVTYRRKILYVYKLEITDGSSMELQYITSFDYASPKEFISKIHYFLSGIVSNLPF